MRTDETLLQHWRSPVEHVLAGTVEVVGGAVWEIRAVSHHGSKGIVAGELTTVTVVVGVAAASAAKPRIANKNIVERRENMVKKLATGEFDRM